MRELQRHINHRSMITFLDLEGTQFSHEMIAIGAVKVSLKKDGSIKKIHQGYYSLVKPKNKIGKVVVDLTHLTEDDVKKNGKPFRVVINDLKKYLGREFTKTLWITFGNHDQRILAQSLAYNLDAPKEDVQLMIKHSFDFSEFTATFVRDENSNTYSLANLLKLYGVDFKGTQHNALADAINLAYLYQAFIDHKEITQEEYKKVLAKQRHLPEPIHNLLTRLIVEKKSISPEDFDESIKEFLQ